MEEAISDIRSAGEKKHKKGSSIRQAEEAAAATAAASSIFLQKAECKNHPSTKGHCCAKLHLEKFALAFARSCKSKVQECTLLFVFRSTQSLNFVPGRRMFYESAATKNERREGRADKKE